MGVRAGCQKDEGDEDEEGGTKGDTEREREIGEEEKHGRHHYVPSSFLSELSTQTHTVTSPGKGRQDQPGPCGAMKLQREMASHQRVFMWTNCSIVWVTII